MMDQTRPHKGQTWAPLGYPQLRDLVLDVIEVDGEEHVVWRGPSSRPQISTVAEFVTDHTDPQWQIPDDVTIEHYRIARVGSDGGLWLMSSHHPSAEVALRHAGDFDDQPVIGIMRVVTTETHEWVAVDELLQTTGA